MVPLVGYVTVLQAVSQAGGLKESARRNEIVVIRHGVANKPLALVVNLEKVYDGTDMRQDIPLKPFDIVYVPRS
jgi:protein involved in polysaccharide export with SLBB domain